MNDIKKLIISKISICVNSNPSTGKKFVVQKSDAKTDELKAALIGFWGSEEIGRKAGTAEEKTDELIQIINELKPYQTDFPTNTKNVIDILLKIAFNDIEQLEEEKGEVKKTEKDLYPSLKVDGDVIETEEIDEEEEWRAEEKHNSVENRLERIERGLTKGNGEQDPYPSLNKIIPANRIEAIEKFIETEEEEEEEPETRGVKKSIDGQDSDVFEDDFEETEDNYPSIPDNFFG